MLDFFNHTIFITAIPHDFQVHYHKPLAVFIEVILQSVWFPVSGHWVATHYESRE